MTARPVMSSWSLANATMLPENVTVPMSTLSMMVVCTSAVVTVAPLAKRRYSS